jgi:outer membrane protein insertion porin family
MTASVNVERSDSELSGKLSLANPRVFDSIYSLAGSVYRTKSDYTYNTIDDYTATTTGFNLSVGRSFGRHWRGSLGYVLEDKQYSDYNTSSVFVYTDLLKSSIVPSVTYNTTDDYYLPRKGINFKSSLEFAGVGGDAKFTKSVTKFNYFYGLRDEFKYDLILRYKSQFQYLLDNGQVPVDEYLKMGGISTVRGYSSGTIGPEDSTGSYYNGTMMLVNTVEASFPLIERLKMRGAVFFDYGMIGQKNLSDEIRAGTGAVLEWVSPMGPISLVFAKALLEETGDDTSSFEFTMGRQF